MECLLDNLTHAEKEFRAQLTEGLVKAANKAEVSINPDIMVSASKNNFFVALALVPTDECDMFGFLSLPENRSEGKDVPADYYLFDITLESENAKVGTAKLINTNGREVLNNLPVTVENAPIDAPEKEGLSLTIDALEFKAKRWKPQGSHGSHIVDILTIRF